jgi:hypothetical protein
MPRMGVHRGRRRLLIAITPSLIAIIAVMGVIAALFALLGSPPPPVSSGASQAAGSAPETPAALRSPNSSTPTPSPVPPSASIPAAATTPEARRISVVVLNETVQRGLGAAAAREISAAGWTVVRVGNFRGTITETTIYYPDGEYQSAVSLRRAFPLLGRLRPAFPGISLTSLTVILTSSYAS